MSTILYFNALFKILSHPFPKQTLMQAEEC